MATDLCQRWRDGRHSWRHRSEGGFDRTRYEVAEVDEAKAKAFVVRHHYSGSYPSARARFGLYRDAHLVGAAVLSVPTNTKALTNVFPGLVPFDESIELGRFVLVDDVPANGESFFLAQAFRLAGAQGFRAVLSMSDPQPRRAAGGALVVPGHVGTIYQATNALYLGRATARTLYLLPDGSVLNARAMQKVRSQERGHRYVERRLQDLGAAPLRSDQEPTPWLHAALDQVAARRIRHRGNTATPLPSATPPNGDTLRWPWRSTPTPRPLTWRQRDHTRHPRGPRRAVRPPVRFRALRLQPGGKGAPRAVPGQRGHERCHAARSARAQRHHRRCRPVGRTHPEPARAVGR